MNFQVKNKVAEDVKMWMASLEPSHLIDIPFFLGKLIKWQKVSMIRAWLGKTFGANNFFASNEPNTSAFF